MPVYFARRDTVIIPAYSWMILRFVTDNPGLWAFHCRERHSSFFWCNIPDSIALSDIVWHMAAGLLMQINSLPSKAAQLPIPQTMIDMCTIDA